MFRFGVDYYPEHWPQERWTTDARLMQEAGINTVRLAEFAWSYLEPRPDHFDFDWLDQALDILQAHGIQAILGTPTASPAPWVMALYPDAYRVSEYGLRQTYGNRREYCPTHPGYRERSRIITRAMAEHYADHPAVIGWQTDNELSGYCFCAICRADFQIWLREKYGSLDALNDAWGTAFWSHVYTEWSQIPMPLQTGGVPNPGLDLDYRRFMSDAHVRFQQEQVDILRQVCPNHFVTHNFMGFGFDQINYFDLARPLDFVAWDNYPRGFWNMQAHVAPSPIALSCDTMRGLKHQNVWVMEQQSGPSGWQTVGMTPRPGEIRLWTYQAIAHGADAIVYFRWRTARFGTEQYWHGVLDHDGQPRRRYGEIQAIGAELGRVGEEILGTESRAQVAMLLSYDTRFAFHVQPNHDGFKYPELFGSYYAALHRRNVGVDIVPPTADLSGYHLVLAPALHVLSRDAADNLRRYVENGGILLTTARSGVKDEANAVVNMSLPGLLAEVCGVEVDEYDALPADASVSLELELPGLDAEAPAAHARLWCDLLTPTTAQTVARYGGEYYAGRAAITRNRFGQGQAVYVGTLGDEALHDAVVGWLVDAAAVSPALTTPGGVEAVERWKDRQRLLFLLNHADHACDVVLPQQMTDLLTGQVIERQVTLEPKAVMILRET
ncbi:MAG: beta-galactosidase [Anaerolineae bacterium]